MQGFNKYLAGPDSFFLNLHMADNLRIAIAQADLQWEDREGNLRLLQDLVDQGSEDVDLIILPEMFTTGFSMNAKALAEPPQGTSYRWMCELASRKNAAVTGSIITTENGSYYNRLYFVYPDGQFKTYDKRHTFTFAGEHETYSRGKDRLVVDYKGWRICPLICYDLRFPVWSRNTEQYDLLVYVANWPSTRISAWDVLLQARAIENMSYCAGVNRVGRDGKDLEYTGHSAIYDCLGKPLWAELPQKQMLARATLSKEHLQKFRNQLRFLQDADSFTLG